MMSDMHLVLFIATYNVQQKLWGQAVLSHIPATSNYIFEPASSLWNEKENVCLIEPWWGVRKELSK